MVLGGGSSVPQPRRGSFETFNRTYAKNDLYFRDIYNILNREVMGSKSRDRIWNEEDAMNGGCFAGHLQRFSDKKATGLISIVRDAYRVHAT